MWYINLYKTTTFPQTELLLYTGKFVNYQIAVIKGKDLAKRSGPHWMYVRTIEVDTIGDFNHHCLMSIFPHVFINHESCHINYVL